MLTTQNVKELLAALKEDLANQPKTIKCKVPKVLAVLTVKTTNKVKS